MFTFIGIFLTLPPPSLNKLKRHCFLSLCDTRFPKDSSKLFRYVTKNTENGGTETDIDNVIVKKGPKVKPSGLMTKGLNIFNNRGNRVYIVPGTPLLLRRYVNLTRSVNQVVDTLSVLPEKDSPTSCPHSNPGCRDVERSI